jgi:two-component system response regulator HydG
VPRVCRSPARGASRAREFKKTLRALPPTIQAEAPGGITFVGQVVPFRELQRRYAAWAYERLDGRKVLTAEKLEVDFKTLSRWLGE